MKTYFSILLFVTGTSQAQNLPFTEAWNQINSGSAAQESSRLQTESLNESKDRAGRHWLPKVYLDARSYQTNDPGTSFIGLLQQRSVEQSDFNPDLINHPDTQTYTRGVLGVDLPLYEGGAKSSEVELLNYSVRAQKSVTAQFQLEQYSQASTSYATIAIFNQQRTKLSELSTQISRLIKSYQLGSKSNPVGYSGLLGMKSLANRLQGIKLQYDAQIKSSYAVLKEMGLKNNDWLPVFSNSTEFVDRYLAPNSTPEVSYKIQSLKENAGATEAAVKMEKSKFLPRVGAFAESQLFKGSRSTADSYTAGLYLQWNLFDPSAYGSVKAAKLKAQALQKSVEAAEQQDRAEQAALAESIHAIRENVELLNDSYAILTEQSKMTETLFKNGSLNALQFVEVLSRRADLITQQAEVELSLIKASSQAMRSVHEKQ